MSIHHLLPRLTTNRQFVNDFLAAKAPCFALGMIEEHQQALGLMALRPPQAIPQDVMALGFNFGHSLIGNADYEVLHFAFEFYGFATYNVLLNPSNPLVNAVLTNMLASQEYFFLAIGPDREVTAFRAEFAATNLTGLHDQWPRLKNSRTNDVQYQQTVRTFQKQMPEPAPLLAWVCRDQMAYLDLQQDPMELTPRGAQAPKDKSSTQRLAIARLLDAKVQEFERAGDDTPLGLLAHMAPYMELFHQLMLSTDKGEMNSLCEAHPGLYRYARLLEHLAKGIHSGEIKVPR